MPPQIHFRCRHNDPVRPAPVALVMHRQLFFCGIPGFHVRPRDMLLLKQYVIHSVSLFVDAIIHWLLRTRCILLLDLPAFLSLLEIRCKCSSRSPSGISVGLVLFCYHICILPLSQMPASCGLAALPHVNSFVHVSVFRFHSSPCTTTTLESSRNV